MQSRQSKLWMAIKLATSISKWTSKQTERGSEHDHYHIKLKAAFKMQQCSNLNCELCIFLKRHGTHLLHQLRYSPSFFFFPPCRSSPHFQKVHAPITITKYILSFQTMLNRLLQMIPCGSNWFSCLYQVVVISFRFRTICRSSWKAAHLQTTTSLLCKCNGLPWERSEPCLEKQTIELERQNQGNK